MGKIERDIEEVKHRQSQEEFNKDSAYWKEKARLIKQKEVKEQKEKAREEYAPTAAQQANPRSGKSFTQKVGGFIKERSIAIAHESRDLRAPRKQNYGGSVMGGGDLFGVGGMGGGFGGGNPFASSRPEPAPRPRRKKRKSAPSRRRSAPRQSSGGMNMMGGIPKHMRWMF